MERRFFTVIEIPIKQCSLHKKIQLKIDKALNFCTIILPNFQLKFCAIQYQNRPQKKTAVFFSISSTAHGRAIYKLIDCEILFTVFQTIQNAGQLPKAKKLISWTQRENKFNKLSAIQRFKISLSLTLTFQSKSFK